MRKILVAGSAAILLSACIPVGQTAGGFVPAKGPQGVRARLDLVTPPGAAISGELLAVSDSALYVLTDSAHVTLVPEIDSRPGHTVVLARWSVIRRLELDQMGTKVKDGTAPDWKDRSAMSRVSRFPQGVSPELMHRLLSAYGQDATVVLMGAGASPDSQ
jgi:hypothetical protein